MMVFSADIVDFRLVPYTRINGGRGRFTKQAQRYLKNKEALAWKFRQSANNAKLLESIAQPCKIMFNVERGTNRRVDLDNLYKAIGDALQQSGVLENDHWITEIDKSSVEYNGKDSVFVALFIKVERE